ncbi:MAG: sigma-70 family RNA polymerase sigma factor [Odoribacter splanchnicus]|nr:sigma-70 family RNA polymerase sigma factor [Odoribacter splanchnicus]
MELEEFKSTVLPLRDKLFRIAFCITRSREEAEDVVQDVMLKVWDRPETWKEVDSTEAYCCRMARNISLGRLALKGNHTEELNGQQVSVGRADLPNERVEKEESLGMLRKLIARLPEAQRMVVQLRDVEGMSYQEIARVLEVSEEWVKVNLFRARKEIKGLFLKIENYGL